MKSEMIGECLNAYQTQVLTNWIVTMVFSLACELFSQNGLGCQPKQGNSFFPEVSGHFNN